MGCQFYPKYGMRNWITIVENANRENTLAKIEATYAKLDDDGKRELLQTLVAREERRRVKFNKSRSPKDSADYAKTRAEVSYVRNAMRLADIPLR